MGLLIQSTSAQGVVEGPCGNVVSYYKHHCFMLQGVGRIYAGHLPNQRLADSRGNVSKTSCGQVSLPLFKAVIPKEGQFV